MGGPRPWASPPVGRPAFTTLERSVCLGARFCMSIPNSLFAAHWRGLSIASYISDVLLHAITPHAYSSVVASDMVRRVRHTTTENLGSLFSHLAHRPGKRRVYLPSTPPRLFVRFRTPLGSAGEHAQGLTALALARRCPW